MCAGCERVRYSWICDSITIQRVGKRKRDDGYKLHWVGEFRCILKLTRDAYQQPFSPSRRKPISLLSISDVRYRGILAGLDPANSTIQLRNGERPIFFRIARIVLTQMLFDLFTDSILYGDGVSKVCIGNAGYFY